MIELGGFSGLYVTPHMQTLLVFEVSNVVIHIIFTLRFFQFSFS
ncbi:hypothetical protein SBF1_5670002 [Candidatus Desulfosporosinus infrequens]|uniref:Uncharacterized protein n=1 Tax=Candidatus Desulfosporosinus infrequens TaxID=2043169 RepID=A0A2U3LKM0_9FIRM|nr:hypothetical protein SBF1_5670002 [Candidatus Desulfosporosinus infrequens]